jgi:hypothetical protein
MMIQRSKDIVQLSFTGFKSQLGNDFLIINL